jgi:hypothetical protein
MSLRRRKEETKMTFSIFNRDEEKKFEKKKENFVVYQTFFELRASVLLVEQYLFTLST